MKAIHWIVMIALTILLSSCDTYCQRREEGRVKFSEAQQKLIPYQKGSVVSFTDKDGHLINFKVTDRKNWWIERDLSPEIFCSDYFRFEKEVIVLNSISDDSKITFWMDLNFDFSNDFDLIWDGSCSIYIMMNLIPQSQSYLDFKLYAAKDGVISSDKLHENIEINNHVYHDVIEISKTIEDIHNQKIPVQLFYAKDYGIIQIKVDNENVVMLNL